MINNSQLKLDEKKLQYKRKLNFESDSSEEEFTGGVLDLKKEINRYRLDDQNDEDVLIYWKNKQSTFPILSNLAKLILSIPATSVPSERLFSHAGYQLWDR